MAGRISDSVVNALLDSMLGDVPYDAPNTIYVGLSSTQPEDDGGNITEPDTAAGYARVPKVNNATNFSPATSRQKMNGTIITFPAATESWGVVEYFILMDEATGGNMLAWGSLSAPQTINIGVAPDFPVNSLRVTAPGS